MTTKIIDPDLLVVGTELTINTAARTYTLNQTGNLGPEGVSLQALYSKFKELWLTPTYQPHPFPMYTIDAEAGKYQIGTDGSGFSGWKPSNDATRTLHRDGGWEEYLVAGTLARVYAGVVTLGTVGSTDQLYYQRTPTGLATNFTFTGPVNEGVQVYGDATNGSLDERAYLKVFARIQGKKYDQKKLSDSGYTGTGPRLLTFAVQNETDLKISATDATIAAGAPYTSISITYYTADQNRTIGGVAYPFRTIINGANATAEQIYEKVQYQLRQSTDIDAGVGTTLGKTADSLLSFVGDTLVTAPGVYIDNFNSNDTNRIEFYDFNSVKRTFPFVAVGTLAFNTNLTTDAFSVYRMYYKTNPGGNFGSATAVTVKNAAGADITGTVSAATEISFDFAYDSNVQGGRTPATDATVVVVAIGKSSGKYVSTEYTITRTVGQRITLVAEKERSYLNP
jgi:hypothetical protein